MQVPEKGGNIAKLGTKRRNLGKHLLYSPQSKRIRRRTVTTEYNHDEQLDVTNNSKTNDPHAFPLDRTEQNLFDLCNKLSIPYECPNQSESSAQKDRRALSF